MKFVSKTLVLATAFIMLGQAVQSQDLKVTIAADGYTEADALAAIDLFRQNCRPLGDKFWPDVTEISVEIRKETAAHRFERGWKNTLSLALKYADDPIVGPAFASGTGVLAGHTLHYDIGGGDTPGFIAIKRSSQYLCGQSFTNDGTQVFVDVPGFNFLDR